MSWFRFNFELGRKAEERSIENPSVPISSDAILEILGGYFASAAGVSVNAEKAMEVPAVWAAVNFISGSFASLPLHLYRRNGDERVRADGALARLLGQAPNPETTSFDWRKGLMQDRCLKGRGYTWIERAGGRIVALWPLDPTCVRVKRARGRMVYEYTETRFGRQVTVTYDAAEIIDIPWSLKPDRTTHRDPVMALRNSIGLTIGLEEYGSRFFQNGGVPPLALEGPITTERGVKNASNAVTSALDKARSSQRNVLVMPAEHKLHAIGVDPEKMQMVEVRRFQTEETARIFSLPPVFLQDLTHGTFSNTEQQDLHLVKHTLTALITQAEQEINLKLFGGSDARFVKFNLDGLLRGDFKARMEGYAKAIQNAIYTPNEARRLENLPDDDKGGDLLIQGATVPLGEQPMKSTTETPPAAAATEDDDDEQQN